MGLQCAFFLIKGNHNLSLIVFQLPGMNAQLLVICHNHIIFVTFQLSVAYLRKPAEKKQYSMHLVNVISIFALFSFFVVFRLYHLLRKISGP